MLGFVWGGTFLGHMKCSVAQAVAAAPAWASLWVCLESFLCFSWCLEYFGMFLSENSGSTQCCSFCGWDWFSAAIVMSAGTTDILSFSLNLFSCFPPTNSFGIWKPVLWLFIQIRHPCQNSVSNRVDEAQETVQRVLRSICLDHVL